MGIIGIIQPKNKKQVANVRVLFSFVWQIQE